MKIITLLSLSLFFIISCTDITDRTQQFNELAEEKVPIQLSPLDIWQEQAFSGSTEYSVKTIDGYTTIVANSDQSASMLLQTKTVDLNATPFLNWEWKVNSTLAIENEQARSGDDFPARVYIAVKNKGFSIYPRALNYVWANHTPVLEHWLNPYSQDVVMFALQSGNNNSQQWQVEKRNLKDDLLKLFDEEITQIEGIAIMTDTDNSQSSAMAFYRNIYFSQK